MSQPLDSRAPARDPLRRETPPRSLRLSTPWQMVVAALLGGPIAAGRMASNNFDALGDTKRSNQVLLGSVVWTVVWFKLAILVPGRVPTSAFLAAHALLVFGLGRRWFRAPPASASRRSTVGVIALSLIWMLATTFAFIMVASMQGGSLSGHGYGRALNRVFALFAATGVTSFRLPF